MRASALTRMEYLIGLGYLTRRARVTISEKETLAEDSEEMQRKRELEAEERRKQSHDMVAESIRRELAESTLPSSNILRGCS